MENKNEYIRNTVNKRVEGICHSWIDHTGRMEVERYVKQVLKCKTEMEKVFRKIYLRMDRLVWKPVQVKRSDL
jgi:hypothetical protein